MSNDFFEINLNQSDLKPASHATEPGATKWGQLSFYYFDQGNER